MEIQNKRTITLDLRQNTVIPLPQFIQNDTNTIEFDIKDNGTEADLTNIGRIVVNYKRPDRVVVSRLLSVVSGNVPYTIGLDEMSVAGYGELEIQFYNVDNTKRISTKRMKVFMLESIGTDQLYTNDPQYTTLETLFTEVDTAKTNAETATTNANNAADYANNAGDTTKLTWKGTLLTYADLPASPVLGDTYQVENDTTAANNGTWRWDGVAWVKINSPQAYDTRLVNVETNLSKADTKKQTLTHGTQVIKSDQSSPLKVEFDGNTLVNQTGREGGFHKQGKWGAGLTIDTATYKFGTSSGKIDNSAGTSLKSSINTQKMYLSGKYILFGVSMKATSGTPTARFSISDRDSTGALITGHTFSETLNSSWGFYWGKIDFTAITANHQTVYIDVSTYGTANDIVNFDGLVVYELTSTQFNEIGVSLTDADVERMFPYCDSVQHARNVYAKVEGANLIPPFTEWNLHANAKVISPYVLELNATAASQASFIDLSCVPNQDYTLGAGGAIPPDYRLRVFEDGINIGNVYDGSPTFTWKTKATAKKLSIKTDSVAAGTFTFTNPMLNLGSTALPFVERNPSYLYAETVLAGNSLKKDISYYNEGKSRWEKLKKIEPDVVMDGSFPWVFRTDFTGEKEVKLPVPNNLSEPVSYTQTVVKYDGSIIKNTTDLTVSGEVTYLDVNNLVIRIPDTDSGWLKYYKPVTNDIKGMMYGWKVNGYTAGTDVLNEATGSLASGGTYNLLNPGNYRNIVVEKSADNTTWAAATEGTDYTLSWASGTGTMTFKGLASQTAIADATTAPTLSQVANANSTLTAATYYVKYTWKNGAGETLGSTESSLATTAGNELHISVPAFPSGVSSAGVYVSTATGAETYQGDIATSGTDYVLTADPTTTGASVPTTNTTSNILYRADYNHTFSANSWASLVDGTAPSTNTLAYVSANMATGFTPYELTYELANSVVEPVTVEGDLSISGDAQVSVGEGVIVREKATPVQYQSSDYFINREQTGTLGSGTNHRLKEFIEIYKNGSPDEYWIIESGGENGNYRAKISPDLFDTTATYTVTYEILDKYNFTTNVLDVPVWYNSSLKASFDAVVGKQSDIATEVSILDRQMLDVLVRLKAGGL